MTEPYIGEVQLFAFNFNPMGWAFCNGALMPIAQHTALYSLIGGAYGGSDTIFQLPHLDGRAVCGYGNGNGLAPRPLGQAFGDDAVELTYLHLPSHSHSLDAWSQPDPAKRTPSPSANGGLAFLDADPAAKSCGAGAPDTQFHPGMLWPEGQGTPVAHENRQPYLALNFCIALEGIYPTFD